MDTSETMTFKAGPYGHEDLVDRIKKSLYYGKGRRSEEVMICPSLPLTEATVELFDKALRKKRYANVKADASDATGKGLDVLDMNYAASLSDKACISPCSLVLAIIYLERLRKRNRKYLRTASPCDLFLISMLVSSKYLFDDGSDDQMLNEEWAELGAISLQSLNKLEIEFLMAIDWNIHVTPEEFYSKLTLIETLVTWKQIQYRNCQGYTYQELLSLEHNLDWQSVCYNALKMVALTFVTYSLVLTSVLATSLLVGSIVVPYGNHSLSYTSSFEGRFVNRTATTTSTSSSRSDFARSAPSRVTMMQLGSYSRRTYASIGMDSSVYLASDQNSYIQHEREHEYQELTCCDGYGTHKMSTFDPKSVWNKNQLREEQQHHLHHQQLPCKSSAYSFYNLQISSCTATI